MRLLIHKACVMAKPMRKTAQSNSICLLRCQNGAVFSKERDFSHMYAVHIVHENIAYLSMITEKCPHKHSSWRRKLTAL